MSGIEKTQESQSFHLTQFQSQIDNLQRLLQSKEKMIGKFFSLFFFLSEMISLFF